MSWLALLAMVACTHQRPKKAPEAREAAPVERTVAAPAPLPRDVRLAFVPGSSRKVAQLIGDRDVQTGEPTRSRTEARFGIRGTDLGYSFEHEGRVWFLFGDTMGERGGDVVATSDALSADELVLDFEEGHDGRYLRVRPDGISMQPYEVPVSGISIDDTMYVVVKTDHTRDGDTDRTVLTRFDERTKRFVPGREISRRPGGKFLKMSLHAEPDPIPGMPEGGPWVLMWGTGEYRASDAYLAIVPERSFESGQGTLYFAGMDGDAPRWSREESDAAPVVEHPVMGDLSVTWVEELGIWLMVYDSRQPDPGILVRTSPTPWGPWSEFERVLGKEDVVNRFIHGRDADDGLDQGPFPQMDRVKETPGGPYAPYVIERFTEVVGDRLRFSYVLSTWNPYVVVLMTSELQIGG